MTAHILSGRELSDAITQEQIEKVRTFAKQYHRLPALAVVVLGDDPASKIYVDNKCKRCEAVGIRSLHIHLNQSISEQELLAKINELNCDESIDGILVQLPLPAHINSEKIVHAIRADKDVDGFHPENIGKLAQGTGVLRPCTPLGVMKLLEHAKIELMGKEVLVIGVSNIVGKPMALELINQRATVTLAHSRTQNLHEKVARADVVIIAIGKAAFLQGSWLKAGAVVIDVGINRNDQGKVCGDVDFASAVKRASLITPVPGGVGLMTVTMLIHNTLLAYEQHISS